MAEYPTLTITNTAIEMIAESQLSGADLTITKVKIGDGILAEGTDIQSMTDVVSSKMEAPMTSYTSEGEGQLSISFVIGNESLEAGFFAREIGIFAKVEDGPEVLYAYTNAGNKCDWIPDKGTPIDSQIVDATIIIGNASNVTVQLTDKAYALVYDLEKHNESQDAHKELIGSLMSQMVKTVNDVGPDEKGNIKVELDAFEVGDIKWSSVDLTQVGWGIANGAEVGRDTYPDLNALYAEKNYPYGAGDGETTFNLPNLIGRFPEGALEAGGYKEAGLPNIEGDSGEQSLWVNISTEGNRLLQAKAEGSGNGGYSSGGLRPGSLFFDASISNPIYGNSDTVQPSSTLLIPYVKLFKGASADSTDLAISEVANDVIRLSGRTHIVDSYNDADGNWYREYSDGWVEQGGIKTATTVTNINLLKPMANTKYYVGLNRLPRFDNTINASFTQAFNKTETSFSTFFNSVIDYAEWYVCGRGANV